MGVEYKGTDKKLARALQRGGKDKAGSDAFRAEYPDVYRDLGDVAKHARVLLVDRLAGGLRFVIDSISETSGKLRAELAGDDPTPVEQLLADQIALCWLHLHWLETRLFAEGITRMEAESLEQRISGAQRRYLAAITTLERVRALMRPAINVQRMAIIGKQQVLAVNGGAEQAALAAG